MRRQDALRIVDDLAQAAYAAGEAGPDADVSLDPYVDRILALTDRTWTGEAKAAFDQALTTAGDRDAMPSADFWVGRAQAAAAIASAEQAEIGNLIAWKALQAQRASSGGVELLPLDDDVTARIEEGLGLR